MQDRKVPAIKKYYYYLNIILLTMYDVTIPSAYVFLISVIQNHRFY